MREPEYFYAEVEALCQHLDSLNGGGASTEARRSVIERESSRLASLADHELHFWLRDEMARLSDRYLGSSTATAALE